MPCLRLLLGAVRGRGSLVWGAWRSGLIPELPEPRDGGRDSVLPPVSAGIAELLQPNCPTATCSSFVIFCQVLSVPGLSPTSQPPLLKALQSKVEGGREGEEGRKVWQVCLTEFQRRGKVRVR